MYPVGGESCEEPVAGAPLVGDLPFGRRIAERRALRDEQGPVGKQVAQVGDVLRNRFVGNGVGLVTCRIAGDLHGVGPVVLAP